MTAARRWSGRGMAALGLLVGAAVTVVVVAPAQWLAHVVFAASAGHVTLAQTQGTVWRGSAIPVLAGGPGTLADDARALPGRLHWRASLGWTSHGPGLRLALQQTCCELDATVTIGVGLSSWRVESNRLSARWPAMVLAGLGTPWNTIALNGWIDLQSPGFAWTLRRGPTRFDGEAIVQVRDAQSPLSPLNRLGSYELRAVGGSVSQLTLQTLSGSLQISGQGQWAAGAPLRFTGRAEANGPQAASLENLLNIIGRRDGAASIITIG